MTFWTIFDAVSTTFPRCPLPSKLTQGFLYQGTRPSAGASSIEIDAAEPVPVAFALGSTASVTVLLTSTVRGEVDGRGSR